MMTAKEALGKTLERINYSCENELKSIEYKIKVAINEGEMYIRLDTLSPAAQQQLRYCGYKVVSHSQYNDFGFCVSWVNPEEVCYKL